MSDAIPSIQFEAKKHAYRQTQDGVVVSFVVHPNDLNAGFAVAPLGTRYLLVVVQLGDDEEPIPPGASIPESAALASADADGAPRTNQPSAAPGGTKPQRTLAQYVGMRCNDKRFQKWVADQECTEAEQVDEEFAATWVRERCRVDTRTEIKPGTEAAKEWNKIEASFLADSGQMAEAR